MPAGLRAPAMRAWRAAGRRREGGHGRVARAAMVALLRQASRAARTRISLAASVESATAAGARGLEPPWLTDAVELGTGADVSAPEGAMCSPV